MYRRGEMVRGWLCMTCGKNHLSTSEAAACRLRAIRGIAALPPEKLREALTTVVKFDASGSE